MKIAAFVLANKGGFFAATTRDDGRIGLPGGKFDVSDKSPAFTALRESEEEGWKIKITDYSPILILKIDDFLVFWYRGEIIKKLNNYKEKKRGIRPILISKKKVLNSGFGNNKLF